MAELHVGLSGFSYKSWQGEGRFYPPEIKQKNYLTYYATRYDTVEMDGTWYRMPGEASVAQWIDQTPEHFRFCYKAHRSISHFGRLKPDTLECLKFMLGRLEPVIKAGRLGQLLVQLPPNMKRDDERVDYFFDNAPKGIRYSIEFRHESWNDPAVEAILKRHGVAWVAADTDELDGQRRDTAGHHYARLRRLAYDTETLASWKSYFQKQVKAGKDCFVFCKHEDEGAPWDWADFLLK